MTQAEQPPEAAPRPMTSAERELQEVLAAARALGIEGEEGETPLDPDTAAVQVAAELGLDQPVEIEQPVVPAFLTGEEQEEDEAPPSVESVQEEGAAWFAVNTYTGHENRVRDSLDLRIRNMDVAHEFIELDESQDEPKKAKRGGEKHYVLVPTQQEVEIRGGKRREVERKLLPGYVLVQIRVDPETRMLRDDSWHVVTGTAGVTGFVGGEDQARPLPPEEVQAIIGQTRIAEPRVRVGFAIDDSVRVTDGPFQDFIAQVDQINIEKGKVRVLISMFGRETPVELDFDQVEKQ